MSESTQAERDATYAKAIAEKLGNRGWRLQNLYWIEDADGQKVKFRLNWAQRAFFLAMWWLNVILKARQLGMSTFIEVLMLDRCLFNPNQTCGIVDKTDDDAKKKLARMEFAYDHLDDPDDPATAPLGAAVKQAVRLLVNNKKELEWSNGSKAWAGTSLRGGTVQFLHISELGYIAFFNPKKAAEIKTGALNTVHRGNIVVIESTHEGGKYGLNYDMVKLAQEAPKNMTEMDWCFHFLAWWRCPEYVLPLNGPLALSKTLDDYFADLEKKEGIVLTPEQKHWYSKKEKTQGDAMLKEFPSTSEEALNAVVTGAIYGKLISKLRRERRIIDFKHDPTVPIYAFWDIGYSDFCAIWLLQFVGRDICALRYYSNKGEAAPYYVARCTEFERLYDSPIRAHYLPHDAFKVEGMGSGKTTAQFLADAGLTGLKKVPRTPDVWVGINHLRGLLPRFFLHATDCGQEWMMDDQRMPSGIACLEAYHTEEEVSSGNIKEMPVHDETSHGCFPAGTLVKTAAGPRPIESIRAGDFVVTPAGHARVTKAGISKWVQRMVVVTLDDGQSVRCTPEHPFLTPEGLTKAVALRTMAEAWTPETSPDRSYLTAFGIGYRAATTSRLPVVATSIAIFIGRCGRFIMAGSKRVITSTISTAMRSIIALKTWPVFLPSGTSASTPERANGTALEKMLQCFFSASANTAKRCSRPSAIISDSVGGSAKFVKDMGILRPTLGKSVLSARRILWITLSDTWQNTARPSVNGRRVVSIEERVLPQHVPVYDLTIHRHGCFFANGILVSNSDGLRTFSEAHALGMLEGTSVTAREERHKPREAVTGLRSTHGQRGHPWQQKRTARMT